MRALYGLPLLAARTTHRSRQAVGRFETAPTVRNDIAAWLKYRVLNPPIDTTLPRAQKLGLIYECFRWDCPLPPNPVLRAS